VLIKTELFPHQRKALTFLLEREQDSHALKTCRKFQHKKEKKAAKKRGSASVAGSTNGDEEAKDGEGEEDKKDKKNKKVKRDSGRSLWEPLEDEHGRVRAWKNKITAEKRKGKEVPDEGKGAILADDVS
jgi:SWI/SNF-related matrix-associated actin-dependent regulator of chromatin subfamily A3